MKRLFFIFGLFLSLECFAQHAQHVNANYQFKGAGADSIFRLPKFTPSGSPTVDTGSLYYNLTDKKIHWLTSKTTDATYIPALTEAQQDVLFPIDGTVIYNTDRQHPTFWSQTFFAWFGWNESPSTIFTPLSGDVVDLVRGQVNVINPAGTLATLTLLFPTGLTANDFLEIKFTQSITSLSYSGASVIDEPASAALGTYTKYIWKTVSWY